MLFNGASSRIPRDPLWETNGTAGGTVREIGGQGNAGIVGSPNGFTGQFTSELPPGIDPQVLHRFQRRSAVRGIRQHIEINGYYADTDALWVTNGTAGERRRSAGSATPALRASIPAVDGGISPTDFTVLGSEALFLGLDADNGHLGLWETNGSASGTVEIGGLDNAGVSGGLSFSISDSPDFTVYNGKVLFFAYNASDPADPCLWSTDGTAAGTKFVATVTGGYLTAFASDNYVGGGQTVTLSSGGEAYLSSTGGDWDTVTGSNGTVYLTSAQASVTGGGDWIAFAGGSGNVASLYSTGGNWDGVSGSNGTVYLQSAQATVYRRRRLDCFRRRLGERREPLQHRRQLGWGGRLQRNGLPAERAGLGVRRRRLDCFRRRLGERGEPLQHRRQLGWGGRLQRNGYLTSAQASVYRRRRLDCFRRRLGERGEPLQHRRQLGWGGRLQRNGLPAERAGLGVRRRRLDCFRRRLGERGEPLQHRRQLGWGGRLQRNGLPDQRAGLGVRRRRLDCFRRRLGERGEPLQHRRQLGWGGRLQRNGLPDRARRPRCTAAATGLLSAAARGTR